ncbi:MAG: CAP domain-containing protein [Thermodesulfobacteriota bacterium]
MLTALLAVCAVGSLLAESDLPTPQDEALLALINQARLNPLETAASLGLDPDKVLADFPELETVLINGLSPLTFNQALAETACAHDWDMLSRNYYSSTSPDGQGYEERIREAGYPAVVSGESLGMIVFANFINPDEAVRLIFEYMFLDELNPDRKEKRNILDPCLMEAGISVQTGKLRVGGGRRNVYVATCDFGAVMPCAQSEFLRLVNQARVNPLGTAEALGLDPVQVLKDFPDWKDMLNQGLPPLTVNLDLQEAAESHAEDMMENGYFSHKSQDGRTFEDRIREAGYEAAESREQLWRACLGDDDEWLKYLDNNDYGRIRDLMGQVFKNMFSYELNPSNKNERNLLNGSVKEIGIGIAYGESAALKGICGDRILLMVLNLGSRSETEADEQ